VSLRPTTEMACFGLHLDLARAQALVGKADPDAPLVVGLAVIDGCSAFSVVDEADRHAVYEWQSEAQRGFRLTRAMQDRRARR
jgi:hypothetical protein